MNKQAHHLFLNWLILTGIIIFCFIVTWHQGLFYTLFSSDSSKISVAICLIYTLGSLHCAIRALQISKQLWLAEKVENTIHNAPEKVKQLSGSTFGQSRDAILPTSIIRDYLSDIIKADGLKVSERNQATSLADIYSDRLKATHDYGWFFVDSMIKLGLLGTIVGFILMLGSVSDTSSLDVNAMQKVMQEMSSGMGTALYTTLVGLIGSLLLALQYQLLDRGADDLMNKAVHLAEIYVLPDLNSPLIKT